MMAIVSAVGIAVGNHFGGDPDRAERLRVAMEDAVRRGQANGASDEELQVMIRDARAAAVAEQE